MSLLVLVYPGSPTRNSYFSEVISALSHNGGSLGTDEHPLRDRDALKKLIGVHLSLSHTVPIFRPDRPRFEKS